MTVQNCLTARNILRNYLVCDLGKRLYLWYKRQLRNVHVVFVEGGRRGLSYPPTIHPSISPSTHHPSMYLSSIHDLSIHPIPSPFFSPKLHTYIFYCLYPLPSLVMDSCSKIPRHNEWHHYPPNCPNSWLRNHLGLLLLIIHTSPVDSTFLTLWICLLISTDPVGALLIGPTDSHSNIRLCYFPCLKSPMVFSIKFRLLGL